MEKISQEQSVQLIKEMILQAKGNIANETGIYFLLWGYVIVIASILDFVIKFTNLEINTGYVWIISVLIGAVCHYIIGQKEKNNKTTTTHIDFISSRVWLGFIAGVLVIQVFFWISGDFDFITPSILFIYTFALYLTAVVCKFKQLYISVAICVCCLFSYLFISPIYHTIPMAIAMLSGNIIPGHLLNSYRKKNV